MNVRGTNVRMGQHNANPIPLALARWQPRLEGGHRSGESQKKKFTSLKSRHLRHWCKPHLIKEA